MGPGLRRDDTAGTSVSNTNALQNVHGTIALAGAGKMGGAMLTGWLAQGLDAAQVATIEPYPSEVINALVVRGVRLNPARDDVGVVAAMAIALKPQMFREAGLALRPFIASDTLVV